MVRQDCCSFAERSGDECVEPVEIFPAADKKSVIVAAPKLNNMEDLTVYEGHGRLESATSVRVNGDLLEGERIILNVGGRAFVPDMPGISDVEYLTNSSMMEVDFLPDHLLIIGGSYIGPGVCTNVRFWRCITAQCYHAESLRWAANTKCATSREGTVRRNRLETGRAGA